MKLKVQSTDRIGISQEILSVIAIKRWNVIAMEVVPNATYIQLDIDDDQFAHIAAALYEIDGVHNIKAIDVLPTASREQHLNTLLARLPDPIFDVDATGEIISSNQSLTSDKKHENIYQLLNVSEADLNGDNKHLELIYLGKPFLAEISPVIAEGKFNGAVIVLKAMASVGKQLAILQKGSSHQIENIIGETQVIQALKAQLAKFARLDLPILLSGETGTGKELFARAIHEGSNRRKGPFLAINCASLSEQLLESELFGYAAGAFTGAQRTGKPGLLELADGGTVFLDEVAEMSGYLQAKLLRFLQDYSYRRVGGTKELTANVRIISASHQPFAELIEHKVFREDLYYRLNVLSLSLPALRERKQDIPLLTGHFVANASEHLSQQLPVVSESGIQTLKSYPWPGNIRQLQNVLFRLVALDSCGVINADDIEAVLENFGEVKQSVSQSDNNWLECESWQKAQDLFEQQLLQQFMPAYSSTRKLAQRLKVSHNKIAMKLRQHKLNKEG